MASSSDRGMPRDRATALQPKPGSPLKARVSSPLLRRARNSDDRGERGLSCFAGEERAFHVETPREAAETAVGAQDAMARHEEGGGVAGADGCRGTHRARLAERRRELRVG